MAGRAVPEAAERDRNEGVQDPPGPAVTAAAERDVDVVADPEAERDVPADPEILQVARRIGPVEVLRKADAEYPGAADRDVAVAREIHQDPKCYRGKDDPLSQESLLVKVRLEVIDVGGQLVRDQDLLGEAEAPPGQRSEEDTSEIQSPC